MRAQLERQQVWIYLAAIALGLWLGHAAPHWGPRLGQLLWPVLALLLYATFVQVPLLHLVDAFRDRRFLAAALVGNFIAVPLLCAALAALLLPADVPLRLGVLLVLLVPYTDWFITFTQLGRGDVARAIALAPLVLLLQLLLLPLYLWLLLDGSVTLDWQALELAPALAVVGLPLLAAALSERWIEQRAARERWREALALAPVPLLAVVVLLIAASQFAAVQSALAVLPQVVPLFVLYLLLAAVLARALARWYRLPPPQGRTLAFSLGTRNSFVVLPFALALPAGWEVAAVVIVVQSLVELLGMVLYLWWVPQRLFR